MFPIKSYIPVLLESTTDSNAAPYVHSYGLLVIWCCDETYTQFVCHFYPKDKGGSACVESAPSALEMKTCYDISFTNEHASYTFDLTWAMGVDYKELNPHIKPLPFDPELDSLYIHVVEGLLKEGKTQANVFDVPDQPLRAMAWQGLVCDYVRRKRYLLHEEPGDFDQLVMTHARNKRDYPGLYGLYGDGDEVAFRYGEDLKRGVITGLDKRNNRYVLGKIVDIYCAEENMLYKEVSMEAIHGVFDHVGDALYTSRLEQLLTRKYPSIQDSLCAESARLFNDYTGVAGSDQRPGPHYNKGDVVLFREYSDAPYMCGTIVDTTYSLGDKAPYGVYYDIECLHHVATIAHLPESNIYNVVVESGSSWLENTRPSLYWNAHIGGGTFEIYPASVTEQTDEELLYSFAPNNKYNAYISLCDEVFRVYAKDLFESNYNPNDPVRLWVNKQEGIEEKVKFEWYGDNFFGIAEAQAILHELQKRANDDPHDFYRRFSMLFAAVLARAQELNEAEEFPNDFGILVVGP